MANIADKLRTIIPETYVALVSATYYGQDAIDSSINSAKFRLFGTVVAQGLESTVYDDFSQEYVAKVAALRVIPAGIDYWAGQFQSANTREESVQYPDRIAALEKVLERVLVEVRSDEALFERLHPPVLKRSSLDSPAVDTTDPFQTPDPADFGYGSTTKRFGRFSSQDVLPWDANW